MKIKILVTIMLAGLIYGCTRQDLPNKGTEYISSMKTVTQTISITPSIITPIIPTDTPTTTPTQTMTQTEIIPTTSPLPPILSSTENAPYPIRFDANETYKDILGSIMPGESKTYSIRALEGQIMSVSTLPQSGHWYLPMQIKGADGQILCSQPDECLFWRGVLPSSQNYFITFNSDDFSSSFVLRVAINPPGKNTQLFQYKNPISGLSITYSDLFAPTDSSYFWGYFGSFGNDKLIPELILHLIDTSMFSGTNLEAVYFSMGADSNPEIVTNCTEAPSDGLTESSLGTKMVNDYLFSHTRTGGAALGNDAEKDIFRMVKNKTCYEVSYSVQYTNIGNFQPGTVREFNNIMIIRNLEEILSTFTIN